MASPKAKKARTDGWPFNAHTGLKAGDVVGACVSGGLDSKTIAHALTRAGVKVVCFCADLGQPDETDINEVKAKMAPCGVETVIVDLRKEMAEACFECIMAQATYDGGYWQSTGVGRHVTVLGLITAMKKHGVTVLAHGATGRGNDQMRFERYTNVIAPEMRVYAPWRDPVLLHDFPGRSQMLQYLAKYGIQHELPKTKKRYSTDSNLAGLSNEAEDLEDLETPMTIVTPLMGVWPQDAPDKPEEVVMRFEKGRCVAINGEAVDPLQAMLKANTIGGRNGLGLVHALENRLLGTKSRGVYESPGMSLLGKCLELVYQGTIDRRACQLMKTLSAHVSDQLYDGRYFDPSTRAALGAIRQMAQVATGTVKVHLYKGNVFYQSLTEMPHTLYKEEDSSMEASSGLNPTSSQGYAEIQRVEAVALAEAKQIQTGC
eukprot:TRINITY_DN19241_c0_g1_i1.p2 TRINITY_DN19241_c0_g1~~TRINITY_DN19241_c0_g1_i1.p2  ORF type:complete len:453 (+),score=183.10 TRINITY_DN19241_c0_g1_i1:68-1360(+)